MGYTSLDRITKSATPLAATTIFSRIRVRALVVRPVETTLHLTP